MKIQMNCTWVEVESAVLFAQLDEAANGDHQMTGKYRLAIHGAPIRGLAIGQHWKVVAPELDYSGDLEVIAVAPETGFVSLLER